jgi:hypothetical protein
MARYCPNQYQPLPVIYDPYVCEYLLKPEFWLLGIALVAYSIATVGYMVKTGHAEKQRAGDVTTSAAPQNHKPKTSQRPHNNSNTPDDDHHNNDIKEGPCDTPPPQPQNKQFPCHTLVHWLTPHLPTKPHRAAAVAFYVTILGAQLLEGYWAAATLGRVLAKLFRMWLLLVRSGNWWVAVVYTIAMVFLSLLGAAVAYAGVMLLGVQVGCIGGVWACACQHPARGRGL